MNDTKAIWQAVFEHAERNYEHGGWDYIIECWSARDVEAKIIENNLETPAEAIEWFGRIVGELDSVRRDIQAEAF